MFPPYFADSDVVRINLTRFRKGLRMKKALTMVGGIAICLLFSGVSAVCQGVAPEIPRVAAGTVQTPAVEEHPLMPVIRWAERERPIIAAIKDYTATVRKQESIGGHLHEAQVMEVKVRHEPFSVYLKFRFPHGENGKQAIFVRGKNDNKVVGHGVTLVERMAGTQFLAPDSFFAMRGQKYPITEMGILNLVDKLLEVGYKDIKFGECEVQYIENSPIGSGDAARLCTQIRIIHPVRRPHFTFHVARIFVDKELNLPIHYDSYDWPRREGETPQLIEAYSYRDLKFNVGLTDLDFDHKNPAYAFP